jgi:hypothetical protein
MTRTIRFGLAAASTVAAVVVGCADSGSPTGPASIRGPAFNAASGTTVCTPCPPGLVCAAVCTPYSVEIVVPDATDATGTDTSK